MKIDVEIKNSGSGNNDKSSSATTNTKILGTSVNSLARLTAIATGVTILAKASSALQGTLKILEKAFIIAFKPLGDIISRLLRPFLLLAIRGLLIQQKEAQKLNTQGDKNIEAGKKLTEQGSPIKGAVATFVGEVQKGLGEMVKLPLVGQIILIVSQLSTIINDLFKDMYSEIFKWSKDASAWVVDNIITPVIDFFKKISQEIANYSKDIASWIFDNIITPVIDFFKKIYDSIPEYVEKAKQFIRIYVSDPIKGLFEWLKKEVDKVYDTVSDWVTTYISNPIKSVLKWISDKISSIIGSSSSSKSSKKSVNDAIIAPGGKIITTSPQDYLIATKNPSELVNSNNNTSPIIHNMNINLSVQELNSDADLNRLADKISQVMQRKLSYRTSGGI